MVVRILATSRAKIPRFPSSKIEKILAMQVYHLFAPRVKGAKRYLKKSDKRDTLLYINGDLFRTYVYNSIFCITQSHLCRGDYRNTPTQHSPFFFITLRNFFAMIFCSPIVLQDVGSRVGFVSGTYYIGRLPYSKSLICILRPINLEQTI